MDLRDITEKCDYRLPNLRIVGGYNQSRGSGDTCLCPDTQEQGDPSLPVAVLFPELKKKKKKSLLFVFFQSCRRLRAGWLWTVSHVNFSQSSFCLQLVVGWLLCWPSELCDASVSLL